MVQADMEKMHFPADHMQMTNGPAAPPPSQPEVYSVKAGSCTSPRKEKPLRAER